MYAIVEVGGMQFKVSKSDVIRVPKSDDEPGKTIQLDRVLLIVDKDQINVGKPLISNAVVKAKVLSHKKDAKIKIFKKKRRKGYKVLKGHRQQYMELQIDQIGIEKEEPIRTTVKTVKPPKASTSATTKKPKTTASKSATMEKTKTSAKKKES